MKRLVIICVLMALLPGISLIAQDTGDAPIDFSGTVDAMNGTTLTVAGLTVDVSGLDSDTQNRLAMGMSITVTGTLNNGVVTATSVILPEPETTPEPVSNPITSEPSVMVTANYTISFDGRTYDGTQTTFTYTVTGTGVSPALSHFDVEIPFCTPELNLVAYTPADAVELGIDPNTGIDGIKWDLPLGENESRTYSITFDDFVAEGTVATAVKNGDGFFTQLVPGPSCAQPSVDIEKYISVDNGTTWVDADSAPGIEAIAGEPVAYRLVITNDGNVPLTNITLSDTLMELAGCSVPTELEPDASFECTPGAMTASESQLTNTATVNAAYDSEIVSDSDTANYYTGELPSIDVEKYLSIGDDAGWLDADDTPGVNVEAGTDVYFRFVVTNNSNVPLSGVTLSDNLLDTSTCAIPQELAPQTASECVIGPVLATDAQHTNIASVTAQGNGTTVEDTDTVNYTGQTEPVSASNFTIVFVGSVYANGQTTFTYGVIGNSVPPDLSHFSVEIPICPTPLDVAVTSPTDAVSFGIDPTTGINGIKWDLPLLSTSSRNYSITFDGNIATGTVQAAVKAGEGFEVVTVPGPTCDVAEIVLEKDISLDGGASWLAADAAPGPDANLDEQVLFRFRVQNDGNSPLSGITLTDDRLDLSACPVPDTLSPGGFFECVAGPMPVEQGQHTNTATTRGTFSGGSGTAVDTNTANYFGGDRPEIDVEGYVSANAGASWVDADAAPGLLVAPGTEVLLRYVVSNTGNVDLQGLTLAGSSGDTSACAIPATLPPGDTFECLAGSVTATEGQQTDTVTASATAAQMTVEDSDPTRFFGGELDDDDDVIIIIEGPVEDIDGNTVIIFGIEIVLDPDDPRLTVLQIGDILRIEGDDNGGVLIAIVFIVTDVEIFINDGIVWRDPGTCGNPPPPWAPAWGWRDRCEGGGTTVIITGGSGGIPPGCKLTGRGNGNLRLKCSGRSSR